jgi:rSAM/selenodomain-associated transferase 2
MKISIIVPTLNEEKALPATLENIAAFAPGSEVIVVDGGSADRTRELVQAFTAIPILWLDAPRGRGNQMNAGAARATGDVLLFLHADTHLPPHAPALIANALSVSHVLGGFFRIAFVPRAPLADFYAWCYNLRSHLRIFYGDAALFVRRDVFERMGGYQAALLMEDIELILRLRRAGKLAYVRQGTVYSSSRRFPSTCIGIKMLGVWFWLHILMACGVSQEKLARLYPEKR